jgi:UDP-glucuronate 4-epimerase
LARQPIKVFNYGKMRRDFTYIDDIVEGIVRVMEHIPQPQITPDPKDQLGDQLAEANTALAAAPYQVYNIGNNRPVELLRFIEVLENCLGIKAEKQLMPLQPGDVLETYADIDALNQATGFAPETPLETGLAHFVDWYKSFYKV